MIRRLVLRLATWWLFIGLLTIVSLRMVEAEAQARSGYAARYRPGLMEQVARNRGLPIVPCMVASPYHEIGTWLIVRSRYGQQRCRVTDVCAPQDCQAIKRRGIIVELGYRNARPLCGSTREPPHRCPVVAQPIGGAR